MSKSTFVPSRRILTLFTFLTGFALPVAAVADARVSETYGQLPLYFEANRGQTHEDVRFLAHGPGYSLYLTAGEAVLVLTRPNPDGKRDSRSAPKQHDARMPVVLRMSLVGVPPKPRVSGLEELPGKANYFIGNDPAKWRTNVPIYAKVRYQDLYPGINLVYYGTQGHLEYDFVVAPGADPQQIKLAFQGAEDVKIDGQGDLILQVNGGEVRLFKPNVYQNINGKKQIIAGRYILQPSQNDERLTNNVGPGIQIGFQVAAYDKSLPLIIDPILFYSTYLGGSDRDDGNGVAVDQAGNAYVTGFTFSTDFPTTAGAFQPTYGGTGGNPAISGGDAFVTKLNPTGSGLVYSTYLGGSGEDNGAGIALDAAGNAYIVGTTRSTDFPTTGGVFQPAFAGGDGDAFVTKLDSTGSVLLYSTYLGGPNADNGAAIAVDAVGNAYVYGDTNTPFPTTSGAFQTSPGGGVDVFVTKLNVTGSALIYSSYLGGSGNDFPGGPRSIAVDSAGNAYVSGTTFSTNFPTTGGAFQLAFGGGSLDAFAVKVNPAGSMLVYSTYLGGGGDDSANGVAIDNLGNAYLTGNTNSANFPTTAGAFQPAFAGGANDAFVTKLNPMGSGLLYSTYLGGSGSESGSSITVDALGNAYVIGSTNSANFPTTAGAFQPAFAGGPNDAFVTKVNPLGIGLVYSTYLGGGGDENGSGIALDDLPVPNAYVTGRTNSLNFPTTAGAFDTTFNGGQFDAFVTKITDIVFPPGATTGKVTGGGSINVPMGIGTFGFIVQATPGTVTGELQYVNHATSAKVHSVAFTSFAIVGDTATFGGTCTLNGALCTFEVKVVDMGEPGTSDSFTITINAGPPEGANENLRSGNIQIHQ